MASSKTQGLILLGSGSAIMKEQLSPRILEDKREHCSITFSDFDDTTFNITVLPETLNIIKINMNYNSTKLLMEIGSKQLFDKIFPNMIVQPDNGYNFAIQFNLDNLPNDRNKFLSDCCNLKRHMMGGPIDVAFTKFLKKENTNTDVVMVEYRPNEPMFVCPSNEKVVIIFMVDFLDTTDKAMAKIFLQEFVEAQRMIRTAPPVSYSKEPPMEIANMKFNYNPDCAGFISFGFEERHISGDRKETAINVLSEFRSYLLYHIKCSKTYLHMRMRKMVAGWMQVLNRAKPDQQNEKKTITGKTFQRASIAVSAVNAFQKK
jgi:actin related protein 2/3 complex subunit 2